MSIYDAELLLARRRLERQAEAVSAARAVHDGLVKAKAPAKVIGSAYAKLVRVAAAHSDTVAYIESVEALNPQTDLTRVKK